MVKMSFGPLYLTSLERCRSYSLGLCRVRLNQPESSHNNKNNMVKTNIKYIYK